MHEGRMNRGGVVLISYSQNITPVLALSPKSSQGEAFFYGEISVIAFDFGPKFSLGDVVISPGAALKLPLKDITAAIQRHARGDWGDIIDFEDQQLNDLRLQEGGPIASIYKASNGIKFYVLTEADRATTTVLLPEEY